MFYHSHFFSVDYDNVAYFKFIRKSAWWNTLIYTVCYWDCEFLFRYFNNFCSHITFWTFLQSISSIYFNTYFLGGVTFHLFLVTHWNPFIACYSLQNLLVPCCRSSLLQKITRNSLQNLLVSRCRNCSLQKITRHLLGKKTEN